VFSFPKGEKPENPCLVPQGKRTVSGSPKLMYAVAPKASYVQSIAEAMQEVGLEINAIFRINMLFASRGSAYEIQNEISSVGLYTG
jgi:hypothetical protein